MAMKRGTPRIHSRFVILLTVLTVIGTGTAFGIERSADGFQIRSPLPGITEQTLRWASQQQTSAKVWIYFTDKRIFSSDECAAALDVVRSSLDDHAADRRARSMGVDLVDFRDISVPRDYLIELESRGIEILRESRWLNAVSFRASVDLLRELAALPFVHKMTPVRSYTSSRVDLPPTTAPTSRPQGLRDLFDYGPSYDQLNEIGVIEAHNAGYSGAGVIIGMFDTGFKYDHPAFQQIVAEGRILAQYDFVFDDGEVMDEAEDVPGQQDHGSSVWSACAGFYEGELIGPAYGASFILAKTEDVANESIIEEDNWVAAAEWVDELGGDVISSSLAYHRWYTPDDMDGDTAPVTIGADIAASRGIVVVSGAGNMGDQDWYIVTAPADGDSVIAVGAVDAFNNLAGFSSHGPTADGRTKPEVVARGLGVVCACNFTHDPLDDEFATNSGTSLSCPLVAGAAALVIEARPSWPGMAVREALMMTADNAQNPDNDRGWGRIDVMAALDFTVGVEEIVAHTFTPRLSANPNPTSGRTRIAWSLPPRLARAEDATVELFDVGGRRVWTSTLNGSSGVVDWDGRRSDGTDATAGVLFLRLSAGSWFATTTIILQE